MSQLMMTTVFAGLVCLGSQQGSDDQAKGEIDGKWELVRYVVRGTNDAAVVKSNYVIVRENGIQTITKGGELFSKFRFKIDSKARPCLITFLDLNEDKVFNVGSYEIKEDTMKLTVFSDSKKQKRERPMDFEESHDRTVAHYRKVNDK